MGEFFIASSPLPFTLMNVTMMNVPTTPKSKSNICTIRRGEGVRGEGGRGKGSGGGIGWIGVVMMKAYVNAAAV